MDRKATAKGEMESVGVRRDVFGLERRGLAATVAVVAVVLVYVAGLPLVDALIPTDETTFTAGSSVALTVRDREATGPAEPDAVPRVRFIPVAGWESRGDRSRRGRRTLEIESVTMTVDAAASERSADALERSLERAVRRDHSAVVYDRPVTVETTQGVAGVGASFVSDGSEGWTVAFSHNGAAVSVVVIGPQGSLRGPIADDVLVMVRSIRFD